MRGVVGMVLRALAVAVGWAGAFLAGSFVIADLAAAAVEINIDKSAQQMSVAVDGTTRHVWAVSSGLDGGPPNGTYRPQRLHRHWFSRKYDWSPMPHSIFFHEGYAIHGTQYVSRLGRQASHGCVRLHPANAATLFALVREHGRDNTTIEVTGTARVIMANTKARPVRKKIARSFRPDYSSAPRPYYSFYPFW
jgi:lipoprotein-anchoring transpeptidase ErfK/SrfK